MFKVFPKSEKWWMTKWPRKEIFAGCWKRVWTLSAKDEKRQSKPTALIDLRALNLMPWTRSGRSTSHSLFTFATLFPDRPSVCLFSQSARRPIACSRREISPFYTRVTFIHVTIRRARFQSHAFLASANGLKAIQARHRQHNEEIIISGTWERLHGFGTQHDLRSVLFQRAATRLVRFYGKSND